MALNINGQQVNQIIINQNLFTYEGVLANINMTSAAEHNAKLGGRSLGAFNDDYAQRIKTGTFSDLRVGDYFTVNGHNYKIAGFNYKGYHEENLGLGNHLIMLTDVLDSRNMNSTDTTAGGFAGSSMFTYEIPVVEKQLATDFGEHLLKFQSFLSTSVDYSGAPNDGQWYELTANLCNGAMWWGPNGSPYSNNKNGSKYNYGDEDTQLPIMKLSPDERKSGGKGVWLRDVSDSSSFASTYPVGSAHWSYSSQSLGVRAFFLLD